MVQQKTFTDGPDGKTWDRKVFTTSVSLYERDLELVAWLQQHLGCSRAEVFRTSVRSLAAQLSQIPGKSGASPPASDSINVGGEPGASAAPSAD